LATKEDLTERLRMLNKGNAETFGMKCDKQWCEEEFSSTAASVKALNEQLELLKK